MQETLEATTDATNEELEQPQEDIHNDEVDESEEKLESIEIDYYFTDEDHLKMLEEMCAISDECQEVENEIKYHSNLASTRRKERDERLQKLYEISSKKETGHEKRFVSCEVEYDWDMNVKRFIDPKTQLVLEEADIPASERQEKLDFGKNGSAKQDDEATDQGIDENKKEVWYDYLRNFEFIDRPKGVTDLRLDKIKTKTMEDQRFIDLIKSAGEPENSAEYTQKMMANHFLSLSSKIMREERII